MRLATEHESRPKSPHFELRDPEPDAFRVELQGVVIETILPGQTGEVRYGDVAFCPKHGGWLARITSRNIFGLGCFHYRRWNPSALKADEALNGFDDPLARLTTLHEEGAHKPGWNNVVPTPLEAEIKQFSAEYPYLAAHLKLTRVEVPRLFEPGRAFHSRMVIGHPDIPWQDLLRRHVSGDFGDLGHHDSSVLGDPETLFCAGIEPIATQNAIAISSGRGLVRSAYTIEPPDPLSGKPGRSISVVTVLGLRSSAFFETLMFARHSNNLL